MDRTAGSEIMWTIALFGIFALSIHLPRARGTIYRREDGLIDACMLVHAHPDGRIVTEDKVHYYLAEYIQESIAIQTNNSEVNGNAHAPGRSWNGNCFVNVADASAPKSNLWMFLL